MKSLFAKTDKSIFAKWRYLRLKVRKNKENTKKIFASFDHNFKNALLNDILVTTYKGTFLKLWSKEAKIFLLFSLFFLTFNRKYLHLANMDLSVFANKLFIYIHTSILALFSTSLFHKM